MEKLFKLILLFVLFSLKTSAQERSVFGRVVDSTKHVGINALIIQNKTSGQMVTTNTTGDFFIRAFVGDSIIVMDMGYKRVGIKYDGNNRYPVIETKQQPITLKEIVVLDKRRQELQDEIDEFLRNPQSGGALRKEILGNLLTTPTTQPGLGISIDGLYELWSKKGKLDRKVADLKHNDIKEFYVDLKYNKKMVAQITDLEDFEIEDFMNYCKMSDDYILRASDYDLTFKVLGCLKDFRTSRIFRKNQ